MTACPKPLRQFLREPEPHRDRVRAPEANATDVASQAVRIVGHDRDCVVAIGLEDAYCP